MRLVPETLPRALGQGLSPAYLVAGDEPLLVGEAADAIRAAARAAGFTGRDVLFIERSFDWEILLTELRSPSLFAERRVLELRMASPRPGIDGSQALVAALEDPSPDVLLLLITDKIAGSDRSTAWVKAFETRASCVDADQLQPEQLPSWVASRMRRHGLEPEAQAAQLLAERCEGNLVAAHQEIELLRLLVGAGPVTLEAVAASVANSARFHVFQLGEVLLEGDAPRVLRMLDALKAEGEGLPLVLWCIAEELRSVLQWSPSGNPSARRLFRGGRRRKELLPIACARVSRDRAWAMLSEVARLDGIVKSDRKDEGWSSVARLATEFCIAPLIRAG